MKIIAINSSPKEHGNTFTLLDTFKQRAEEHENVEVEIIHIGSSNLKPCRGCGLCKTFKNSECVIKDDIFNPIFQKLKEADGMVFGTPSYFSGMTPELKALIDKAGCVARANGRLFKHKMGAGVIAQRRGGATLILASINQMFLMEEMIVVGSSYWNFGNGAAPHEVLHDEEALENMKNLADNFVWLGKKING